MVGGTLCQEDSTTAGIQWSSVQRSRTLRKGKRTRDFLQKTAGEEMSKNALRDIYVLQRL